MDKRFDAVDKRLDATQDHVDVLTEGVRILRADTEAGFQAVTATMKSLVEQIHGVRADVVEVHDLRVRLERLEKKVGLRGDSRAAA